MMLYCFRLNRLRLIENNNRFYFIHFFRSCDAKWNKWVDHQLQPKKVLVVLRSRKQKPFYNFTAPYSEALLLIISFESRINYRFLLAANFAVISIRRIYGRRCIAAAVRVSRFTVLVNSCARNTSNDGAKQGNIVARIDSQIKWKKNKEFSRWHAEYRP